MARNQRGIIKKIRDGTFKYESKEQVLTNWAKYDPAQIYEMANIRDNIRDLVDEADHLIFRKYISNPKHSNPLHLFN